MPRTHAGSALRSSAQRRISSWSTRTCEEVRPERALSDAPRRFEPVLRREDALAVLRRERLLVERVDALLRAFARERLLPDEFERLTFLRPALRDDDLADVLRDRDFADALRDRELADFRAVERPLLLLAEPLLPAVFLCDAAEDDLRAVRPADFRAVLRVRLVDRREPFPAARAVSRDTSLLKLLRSPRAVRSCTRSAKPRSSNLPNHSSQSICSRDCCPL